MTVNRLIALLEIYRGTEAERGNVKYDIAYLIDSNLVSFDVEGRYIVTDKGKKLIRLLLDLGDL